MEELAALTRQHAEIAEIMTRLQGLIESDSFAGDIDRITRDLDDLKDRLMVHLTMEDKHIYPLLQREGNDQVRRLACEFQEEMGGLGRKLQKYLGNWSSQSTILSAPDAFRVETYELFHEVFARVDREDQILYPAAASI